MRPVLLPERRKHNERKFVCAYHFIDLYCIRDYNGDNESPELLSINTEGNDLCFALAPTRM